jgi:hypothetical protein
MTIFSSLRRIQQARRNAENSWGVFRVRRDGMPSTRTEAVFNAFRDREDADRRRADLEGLNPGERFVVLPVVRADVRYAYHA